MEIAAVNQEPSAQTLAQSLRSSYRRLCRKHDGLRILQIGFIAVLSACPIDVHAQRVIYDQAKDKEAQDAATAAKDLGSGTLFQKMLHNVDLQSKQEAVRLWLGSNSKCAQRSRILKYGPRQGTQSQRFCPEMLA